MNTVYTFLLQVCGPRSSTCPIRKKCASACTKRIISKISLVHHPHQHGKSDLEGSSSLQCWYLGDDRRGVGVAHSGSIGKAKSMLVGGVAAILEKAIVATIEWGANKRENRNTPTEFLPFKGTKPRWEKNPANPSHVFKIQNNETLKQWKFNKPNPAIWFKLRLNSTEF